MLIRFRRAPIWMLINLAGMGVYLRLASEIWAVPGEEGLPGGPGDPFYWFFVLLPFLFVYLTINLIALYAIIKRTRKTGNISSLCTWITVAVLWIATNTYDNHRLFRNICPADREYFVDGVCVSSPNTLGKSDRTPE